MASLATFVSIQVFAVQESLSLLNAALVVAISYVEPAANIALPDYSVRKSVASFSRIELLTAATKQELQHPMWRNSLLDPQNSAIMTAWLTKKKQMCFSDWDFRLGNKSVWVNARSRSNLSAFWLHADVETRSCALWGVCSNQWFRSLVKILKYLQHRPLLSLFLKTFIVLRSVDFPFEACCSESSLFCCLVWDKQHLTMILNSRLIFFSRYRGRNREVISSRFLRQ